MLMGYPGKHGMTLLRTNISEDVMLEGGGDVEG